MVLFVLIPYAAEKASVKLIIAIASALLPILPALAALAQAPNWTLRQAIPAPTGRFNVGTLTLRIVDSSRATSRHITDRPLTVQVWYPALGPKRVNLGAPYISEPGLVDSMIARAYLDLRPDDIRVWGSLKLTATPDASPAQSPHAGWPVLVLSHGMGVSRVQYSSLSQELASHGYVVLAIDHPIGGFMLDPDGRVLTPGVDSLLYPDHPLAHVVRDWAGDAAFAIREVTRRLGTSLSVGITLLLDTARVGMVGHSLGGAAALQACRSEPLFNACADMDGYPFGDVEQEGVGRPFLTLLSEPDHRHRLPPKDSAEAAQRERFAQMGKERDSMWAAIGARFPRVPSYIVELQGTGHMSFSDAPFEAPTLLQNVGATLSPSGMYRLISEYLLAFFDHYVRGQPLRLIQPGRISVS
jgi:dienelactone hydrolase